MELITIILISIGTSVLVSFVGLRVQQLMLSKWIDDFFKEEEKHLEKIREINIK